jgi:hypothetical protein
MIEKGLSVSHVNSEGDNSVDVSLALAFVPRRIWKPHLSRAGHSTELPLRGAAATPTHSLDTHHPVASHSYGNASSVLAMVHLP